MEQCKETFKQDIHTGTGLGNRPCSIYVNLKRALPFCFMILALLASSTVFLSCSQSGEEKASDAVKEEKTSNAVKPVNTGIYKIKLTPAYADRNSTISVKVKSVHPSNLTYQWVVNGSDIEGAVGDVLEHPELKKNDRIQAKIFIKDKKMELISEPLVISNIVPHIQTAKLVPDNPKKGDKLRTEVNATDNDGDTVWLTYEWFINGEPAGMGFDSLDINTEAIKRGDKISVKITPSDGDADGRAITIYSNVGNSPPEVLNDMKAEFKGKIYSAKVVAKDPDGDVLVYGLQTGPEAMQIDSQSGLITWNVKPEDKGEHNIVISVKDGHGSSVLVPLTLKIGFTPGQ